MAGSVLHTHVHARTPAARALQNAGQASREGTCRKIKITGLPQRRANLLNECIHGRVQHGFIYALHALRQLSLTFPVSEHRQDLTQNTYLGLIC